MTSSKTRELAVSHLYASSEGFAEKAAPIFQANDWKWAFMYDKGPRCPDAEDINATLGTLIWEVIKHPNQRSNHCSTGRISVRLWQSDRGDWYSEIALVPVSVSNY